MATILGVAHLQQMCRMYESAEKSEKLSATRLRLCLGLVNRGLMKQDDENYIHLSEAGDNALLSFAMELNKA